MWRDNRHCHENGSKSENIVKRSKDILRDGYSEKKTFISNQNKQSCSENSETIKSGQDFTMKVQIGKAHSKGNSSINLTGISFSCIYVIYITSGGRLRHH